MECPNCGNLNAENQAKCYVCGMELNEYASFRSGPNAVPNDVAWYNKPISPEISGIIIIGVIIAIIVMSVLYQVASENPKKTQPTTANVQQTPAPPPAPAPLTSYRFYENYGHPEWDYDTCQRIAKHDIWTGMTTEQLRLSQGEPDSIISNGSKYGSYQQWGYGSVEAGGFIFFYFEDGVLTSTGISKF